MVGAGLFLISSKESPHRFEVLGPTLGVVSMPLELPDEVARRLAAEAARRGLSPEEVAVEAIEAQLPPEAPERRPRRRLSFVGMGASESGRRAAETDAMLAEGFGRDETPRERFGFVGMGDSDPGGGEIGRRHEEILREHFATKTARDV